MRLSKFILGNIEPIVQEWEDFARSLGNVSKPLNDDALRDHAELMLRAIAADLATAQTARQQVDKSKGHGPEEQDSAAEAHATTRLLSGFTLDQVVSEFRALRASVIKLWMRDSNPGAAFQVEDLIRFNEAIDQALAESIASYAEAVQASRNIFLGILGHDLRSPLSAILLGADVLLRTDDLGARPTKIVSRIYSSVKRASEIVGDLLDFTRSQVGPGIPVRKAEANLVPVCERIVEECRTVHADADIVLHTVTSAIGDFDGARLEQVFSNLINNAVQHGDSNAPVTVTLERADDALVFSVHNTGRPIPDEVLPSIFNPMDRYSPKASSDHGPYASLGLGLFIAAEIVTAHAGHIEVTSDAAAGTAFVVRLPAK